MCLVRKPALLNCWSTDPILQNNYARAIDTFLEMLAMLHLNDNNFLVPKNHLGYDPMYEIPPILDIITRKCRKIYTSEEFDVIDEASCGFRRRVSFRVYMKGKPQKYCLKIFELCEARSGYVSNLEVYVGSHSLDAQHNSALNVVDRLCEEIQTRDMVR